MATTTSLPNGEKRRLASGDQAYDKISHKEKILLIKRVIYDRRGIKEVKN
jgi:hypothetical protein